MKLTDRELKRFWKKVDVQPGNSCWLWKASLTEGYGRISFRGKLFGAHRISFMIASGRYPAQYILHRCDVPACVNPDHLFEGTQRDNVYDCIKKSRRAHLFGENHGKAKFTEKQVVLIRSFRAEFNVPVKLMAEMLGVTETAVHSIITGKNWGYLCA